MTDQGTGIDSVRRTVSTVTSRVVDVLTALAIVAGLTVWSGFWANLARLHYTQGDLPSALFTAAVFIAPAVWALVWYVGDSLGADLPAPIPDIEAVGS